MSPVIPKRKRNRKRRLRRVALIVLTACAVVAVLGASVWVAPTPQMFDQDLTLATAESRAATEGKYVLAVSTANWCALCQMYKRGALTDERVNAWVETNAVPVYAKVADDPELDARLGVEGKPGALPVTTLLRDGRVVRQHVGVMRGDELLAWLASPEDGPSPAELPE